MAKAFKHNFKTPLGVIDANGMAGYQKCLQEVLNYISRVTGNNPEKRFIDAADLSESIDLTLYELLKLQNETLDSIHSEFPQLFKTVTQ